MSPVFQHVILSGNVTDSSCDGKSRFPVDVDGGGVPAEAPGHFSRLRPDRRAVQTNVEPGVFVRNKDDNDIERVKII